jgi:hypothetical protein
MTTVDTRPAINGNVSSWAEHDEDRRRLSGAGRHVGSRL